MKATPIQSILAGNVRHLLATHPTISTQTQLAKKCGVSQSTIQRILKEEVSAQLNVTEAIAQAFGVSVAELLTEGGPDASGLGFNREKFSRLPESDKEKAISYINFLIHQQQILDNKNNTNQRLISFSELVNLPEDKLAQIMRTAFQELNNNPSAKDDNQKTNETKKKISIGN